MGKIVVLRLGHRRYRDKRITTHVCLVARAFGADGCIISGESDDTIIESINDVVQRWGGPFFCTYESNWRKVLKTWKERDSAIIVHLTMYGVNIPNIISEIREKWREGYDILIVVGAEKVPFEVYRIADYNVAISNQPHSEVAALAVFLDWLFEGKELYKRFVGAKIRIVPQERGKKVIRIEQS